MAFRTDAPAAAIRGDLLALAVSCALLSMAGQAAAQDSTPRDGAVEPKGAPPAVIAQASGERASDAAAPSLPEVRVEARGAAPATERASVGGIGDAPIAETPQSISVIRAETLRELGATSLSSALRSETSAGDFYNTVGYVEAVQVRGFLLDNSLNYPARRAADLEPRAAGAREQGSDRDPQGGVGRPEPASARRAEWSTTC